MSQAEVLLALVAIVAACVVSSSAGLGGSLVLVPALALVLGTKEGAAMSALVLAANNGVKLAAYRQTIPWRAAGWVVVATMVGAFAGAVLLIAAPERVVTVAVIVSIGSAFAFERPRFARARRRSAPALALASGLTSGFSGTSGPLKGVALRCLALDRAHLVGAASVVSLFGDLTKSAVYAEAHLLGRDAVLLAVAALPLMVGATLTGRTINRRLGERGYALLFWGVMAGYTGRLLAGL